jgi:hypothetical protein
VDSGARRMAARGRGRGGWRWAGTGGPAAGGGAPRRGAARVRAPGAARS